jgi:hypothetical protein
MRDLPTTGDFGDFYNASKAASELRSYRNRGPIPSTRRLIDALKTEGVEGATVIDIGGGIGAIQHELLAPIRPPSGPSSSSAPRSRARLRIAFSSTTAMRSMHPRSTVPWHRWGCES